MVGGLFVIVHISMPRPLLQRWWSELTFISQVVAKWSDTQWSSIFFADFCREVIALPWFSIQKRCKICDENVGTDFWPSHSWFARPIPQWHHKAVEVICFSSTIRLWIKLQILLLSFRLGPMKDRIFMILLHIWCAWVVYHTYLDQIDFDETYILHLTCSQTSCLIILVVNP